MKSPILSTIAVATIALSGGVAASAQSGTPMTPKDTTSYAIGMSVARSFKDQGLEVDVNMVANGMRDFFAGSPKLTQEQFQATLTALQAQAMERMQAAQQAKAGDNAKKGEAFLAENKKDSKVKVTESGLQYKVIKEGSGKKPTKDNTVKVHYTGKLIDGTVFDSSVERGEPAEFPLSGVISGWTEGLQLMSVGSKYTLFLPPNLAYGANGAGQTIGPNSTLVFDVELIEIVK